MAIEENIKNKRLTLGTSHAFGHKARRIDACISVHIDVYVCISIYIYMRIIFVYVYTYNYIYIYTYIYIYIWHFPIGMIERQ